MSDSDRNHKSEEYDADQLRLTTFASSLEHRERSFEIEDERWSRGKQTRDWVVVLVVLLISLGFVIAQVYLEPGMGSLR